MEREYPKVTAIVVAAGRSTRMGVPKQFLPIAGKPVLAHTLLAFERCDVIGGIVVVAQKEDIAAVKALADTYAITKLQSVVAGGDTRRRSVENGVNACEGTEYVAIHDGARPLVSDAVIRNTVEAAMRYGAAATAVPVKDTIKIADEDGFILSTPDRRTLWAAQTPQVFLLSLYRQAMALPDEVTDDCQLMERLGHPVKLVMGDYRNLKITTPEDPAVAEAYLS